MNGGELRAWLETWDHAHAQAKDELERLRNLDVPDAHLEVLVDASTGLAKSVRELLSNPENVQALALARLMRDRPGGDVQIEPHDFSLPDGYWSVTFNAGAWVCGIAPNGDVSS